ncbi:MAG: hypothetical protein D6712_21075 [Chloroflexi bacterium]|nr:MAG: hypothetical protein D6712_21075 [Chloroflexota bacterium]
MTGNRAVEYKSKGARPFIVTFPHDAWGKVGGAEVFFNVALDGVASDDNFIVATFAEGGAVAVVAPLYLDSTRPRFVSRTYLPRVGWVTLAVVPPNSVLAVGRGEPPKGYIIVGRDAAEYVDEDHPDYANIVARYWDETHMLARSHVAMPPKCYSSLVQLQADAPMLARCSDVPTIASNASQLAAAVAYVTGVMGLLPHIDNLNLTAALDLARTWGCPVSAAARALDYPTSGVLGEVWEMLEHYRATGEFPPPYNNDFQAGLDAIAVDD